MAQCCRFRNIRIINNLVFDTYRSAITFAAVDGGFVEDIVVDSLKSLNTGNVIFLRLVNGGQVKRSDEWSDLFQCIRGSSGYQA
ncbi:MAG: hypothetical protein R2758_13105 [Bacteroidales bacterium]